MKYAFRQAEPRPDLAIFGEIWLASQAKARGWHWNPYKGLYDTNGTYVAGETEESICLALGIGFIQPEARR